MSPPARRIAVDGNRKNIQSTEDGIETVCVSESEQMKAGASDQFDAEYVEHDAAFSVFKSPRPSYTLDEQSRRAVWDRLL